jgi:hypothetical protein
MNTKKKHTETKVPPCSPAMASCWLTDNDKAQSFFLTSLCCPCRLIINGCSLKGSAQAQPSGEISTIKKAPKTNQKVLRCAYVFVYPPKIASQSEFQKFPALREDIAVIFLRTGVTVTFP